MNLPNKITMLRVIMIPFFAFFMLTDMVEGSKYIAAAIFIIASLTDTLDGFIARKYNLVSNFGKFMDPLADKLLVSTALICFVSIPDNPMPVWGVIVIISREFIISGFRLVAANEGIVLAASWWGKVKTTVQMVMSVLLIVNFDGEVIDVIENIFIYAAIALTVISLIDYLVKNWKVLDDGKM
ncbi:CDP-diacylglycerol--glycerol-3-phosphate 3-phosphatidyltransferase [Eubacterium sp. MSJ-13]|uniref:CDP-diacylglycerol--glycerol-3-phosphate 3-phosphatidyltransferase n=1 Tax=Eubacterium sp. MSJ-13 TaxID=2841513 RepID=UPI001C11DBA1|nr:CDP-diacylglycerol--glycerol-3-phosphate 3-phosphatidyltransferase [Eubacterium sp. MSJ-13]MBU5478932.1 CDP-diacylglycerol--glycerol-3-phosphate 3-phosphatidyltransferase [Eubacterium sp. MSJ-13]